MPLWSVPLCHKGGLLLLPPPSPDHGCLQLSGWASQCFILHPKSVFTSKDSVKVSILSKTKKKYVLAGCTSVHEIKFLHCFLRNYSIVHKHFLNQNASFTPPLQCPVSSPPSQTVVSSAHIAVYCAPLQVCVFFEENTMVKEETGVEKAGGSKIPL